MRMTTGPGGRALTSLGVAFWVSVSGFVPVAPASEPDLDRTTEVANAVADTVHPVPVIFQTADRCIACHQGVITATGEDVSIGLDWRASMMANSARDPYWQASVRREVMDHPSARSAIEDKCSTCHMPMARTTATLEGGSGEVFENLPVGLSAAPHAGLAADGVSCTTCHQIRAEGLGTAASFTGGFQLDSITPWGDREVFGPFEVDEGRRTVMRSAVGYRPTEGAHVQSSELCASCHTLYTHALDEDGNEVGELPEQVPFLEWQHSAYPGEGGSCQSCHMPTVDHRVPVTNVLGEPRADVSRHVFRGGNFFMQGMLSRHREELGVRALPQELDLARGRTLAHLESRSARLHVDRLEVTDRELVADVRIENLAGHKLPTAYPSRRAWLHFRVRDAEGKILFESGAIRPDGSIVGNENDDDPRSYELHRTEISRPDQVQIYEAILVDHRDEVTTGLLSGVRWGKDNRIPPRGFDKSTAGPDIAVRGHAETDDDFGGGGDRVRYRVDIGSRPGPYTVEAVLRYQPIGFRWARNLDAYDAVETGRFVRWYDAMAGVSSAPLARVRATTETTGGTP